MNEKKSQKICDEKKWFLNEKVGKDMSGDMDFCDYCEEQKSDKSCMLNSQFRANEKTCGKAYNKMIKKEKR